MRDLEVFRAFEVGDGAGDFEDAGVGAGGHAEAVDAALEEGVAGVVDLAVGTDQQEFIAKRSCKDNWS